MSSSPRANGGLSYSLWKLYGEPPRPLRPATWLRSRHFSILNVSSMQQSQLEFIQRVSHVFTCIYTRLTTPHRLSMWNSRLNINLTNPFAILPSKTHFLLPRPHFDEKIYPKIAKLPIQVRINIAHNQASTNSIKAVVARTCMNDLDKSKHFYHAQPMTEDLNKSKNTK